MRLHDLSPVRALRKHTPPTESSDAVRATNPERGVFQRVMCGRTHPRAWFTLEAERTFQPPCASVSTPASDDLVAIARVDAVKGWSYSPGAAKISGYRRS
jgi:hypothetical protein